MRALVSGAIYYPVWSIVSIITHVAVLPGSKPETRVSEFEWDRSEQTEYHQPDPPLIVPFCGSEESVLWKRELVSNW